MFYQAIMCLHAFGDVDKVSSNITLNVWSSYLREFLLKLEQYISSLVS